MKGWLINVPPSLVNSISGKGACFLGSIVNDRGYRYVLIEIDEFMRR